MNAVTKLRYIKILHTIIWIFFNVVIFYFVYAVSVDKVDVWVWLCLGAIALEGLVLLTFRNLCPVTILARKYSDSGQANFDIYLPNWLAKHNKKIYSGIVLLGILILIYRLIQKA